jgi:hypothetical protein
MRFSNIKRGKNRSPNRWRHKTRLTGKATRLLYTRFFFNSGKGDTKTGANKKMRYRYEMVIRTQLNLQPASDPVPTLHIYVHIHTSAGSRWGTVPGVLGGWGAGLLWRGAGLSRSLILSSSRHFMIELKESEIFKSIWNIFLAIPLLIEIARFLIFTLPMPGSDLTFFVCLFLCLQCPYSLTGRMCSTEHNSVRFYFRLVKGKIIFLTHDADLTVIPKKKGKPDK